jgi:hypothetical protein
MSLHYTLSEIDDTAVDSLKPLMEDALSDGHTSVQLMINEWKDGTNRFSKKGEKIWGYIS